MLTGVIHFLCAALLLSVPAAFAVEPEMPHERAGKYEVSLRLPPDGLYAEEEMQIEFRVVDASQVDPLTGPAPVVRARIEGVIDMPSMPGMPKYEEVAHPEGVPGEYGVHPTFAHGGEFLLHLKIEPPADAAFNVQFPLQVLDAADARKRKPGPRPFQLELKSSPKNPKAGEPAELQFIVHAREKPKDAFSSFEVVHDKLMHLLILRSDLDHFAHEHPQLGADGIFRLRYTFPAGGEYHLFADTAPKGAGSQVMMVKLKVQGKPGPMFNIATSPAVSGECVQKVGGIEVKLAVPNALPAKKTMDILFSLRDVASGQPVTDLQPYLGAMGHLMLVNQDSVTFVHAHPDERQPNVGRNGTVPFLVRFPKPGLYRGWVQFQRNGQVLTSDFILQAGEQQASAGGQ